MLDCSKCNWSSPETCKACRAEEQERIERELQKANHDAEVLCYLIDGHSTLSAPLTIRTQDNAQN